MDEEILVVSNMAALDFSKSDPKHLSTEQITKKLDCFVLKKNSFTDLLLL